MTPSSSSPSSLAGEKTGMLVALLLVTLGAALLPLKLRRLAELRWLIDHLNYLSSGIFLGVAFCHMLSEAVENLQWYRENLDEPLNRVPWTMLTAGLGIMLMVWLDSLSLPGGQEQSVKAAVGIGEGATLCYVTSEVSIQQAFKEPLLLSQVDAGSPPMLHRHRSASSVVEERHPAGAKLSVVTETLEACTHNHGYTSADYAPPDLMSGSDPGVPGRRGDFRLYDEPSPDAAGEAHVHSGCSHGHGHAHTHGHAHSHVHGRHVVEDDVVSIAETATTAGHDLVLHHHHVSISGSTWYAVLLALLFSVHSLIAGIAMGLEEELHVLISLFIAIVGHKWAEALAVGTTFVQQRVSVRKAAAVLAIYSLMTPIGMMLGLLLDSTLHGTTMEVIQNEMLAFAAGSFIAVALSHLDGGHAHGTATPSEGKTRTSVKMAYIIGGYILISCTTMLEASDEH